MCVAKKIIVTAIGGSLLTIAVGIIAPRFGVCESTLNIVFFSILSAVLALYAIIVINDSL